MSYLQDKVVLVTGAGGSIGSALCKQILTHKPAVLVAIDNSELALYNLQRSFPDVVALLGDITLREDANRAYLHVPHVVYHAAAYKHVGICEENSSAAARVNINGTREMLRGAVKRAVEKFILISTDKAVQPSCVMGRTKAEAEKITLGAGYSVVRLGNVWGSSGSVVPLWQEQIANGKPVTITDPRATRYFLHPSEAAKRIIKASEIAEGGDVFVPNMGEAIKVVDVARGLGAAEFKVIGLRQGEKLHEKLFRGKKVKTVYPEIFRDAA